MNKKLILIFSLAFVVINTSAVAGPVVGPSPVKKAVTPGPAKSVKRAATPGPSPVKKIVTPSPVKRAVRN